MKTTLLGRPATNESSDTRSALKKAFAAADEQVPEKHRAAEFLANHLEPALLPLLEQRGKILGGLTNADANLDTLAAAQLAPDAPAQPSAMALDGSHLTLLELEREIAVKRRAIQMQRDIVARTRADWARVVCQQLTPTHRQQVRRIAAALTELSDSLRDHQTLIDALRDSEVLNFSASLRPMFFTKDSMRLDDPSSSASWWMNDAEDAELLG